jgi:hypothetical protein
MSNVAKLMCAGRGLPVDLAGPSALHDVADE